MLQDCGWRLYIQFSYQAQIESTPSSSFRQHILLCLWLSRAPSCHLVTGARFTADPAARRFRVQ